MGRLDRFRVIVTRSRDGSAALADLLRAEGADVVDIPLIETVDPPDAGQDLSRALDDIDTYEWLVVTSPEGARRVRKMCDVGRTNVRIAAVGTATADAIGRVDLVPDVHTGAGLGAAFPSGTGRVLLAVALDAGVDFEHAARSKGWTVDRIAAYATRAIAVDASSFADSVASADAVVFASGSAVRAWVQSLGSSVPRHVVAMGPSTARVLSDSGIGPVAVAAEQSLRGLVDAVVEELGSI